MTIKTWANRLVAQSQRRLRETPVRTVKPDDGDLPVTRRVGRALGQLGSETREAAAMRQLRNARNDLWSASHLDLTASVLKEMSKPDPDLLGRVGAAVIGPPIGLLTDGVEAVYDTVTAGVRAADALYLRAFGRRR